MINSLFLGLLLMQQLDAGTPAQTPAMPPAIVVSAVAYQPDGGLNTSATAVAMGAPTVVHVFGRRSVCETAVSGGPEPRDAGFGWRLTSQTVSVTESVVTVSIDWRRVWDRGQKIPNGPAGTVQLRLHPGDRIPLDHIQNPSQTDVCRAVGMGLEIGLARTAPAPPPINSALLPLGATAGGASTLDADLWLVETTPSGVERTNHQKVRLDATGGSFGFAPMKVSGDRGDVAVEILGSFRRYRAPVGGEYLFVSLVRAISGETLPQGGMRGGTATVFALPGPTEVISLEIPPPNSLPAGVGGFRRGGPRVGGAGGRGAPGSGSDGNAAGAPPMFDPALAVNRAGGGGIQGAPRTGGPGNRGAGTLPPLPTTGPAAEILKGYAFSLRLKLTPVAGM
jgi:hypothetical protein